jgi:hypothetical protein
LKLNGAFEKIKCKESLKAGFKGFERLQRARNASNDENSKQMGKA